MSHPNALLSPLSIAPMIDWTLTHFRVLMRLIAPHSLLYTEMQTTGAIKNNPARALLYSAVELPLALQLGGASQGELVDAAKMAEDAGFSEVNLNLGCPSDKVQAGRFGACLMADPDNVARCIAAMKQSVSIPVTAKTRIGIDKQDSYEFFASFAHTLIDAGCDKLIVHARKAWLSGLNPKQNRTIPPLHYDFAWRIKEELPEIPVIINGNIESNAQVLEHMNFVDGVMIGRLACQNPYALSAMHRQFYPDTPLKSKVEVMRDYINHLYISYENGVPLSLLIKPILNFAHGMKGAKQWKEQLITAQQQKRLELIDFAFSLLVNMEKFGDINTELPISCDV